jgi:SpoIID/LytB domain protein
MYQVLEAASARAAAMSTAGYIMTYNGKPILAEYSSSTGGYTTSGGLPYLLPRPDPWDAGAPLHDWTQSVSAWEIQQVWPAVGAVRDVRVIRRDGRGDFGGRALRLAIIGSRGTLDVSGSSFEAVFGLPSDWFRFRAAPPASKHYRFTFDMGKGTQNIAVMYLQQRLRARGFFPSSTPFTTYFGPITQAALERYQRANHIAATGFLGPVTRARLNATS